MHVDASLTRWRGILAEYASLVLVLVLLVAAFSVATSHFFTVTTLRTVANQVPDILLVATGMTFVIIAGGIDLSVGSSSRCRAPCSASPSRSGRFLSAPQCWQPSQRAQRAAR